MKLKRLYSGLLCAALCLSLAHGAAPAAAFADVDGTGASEAVEVLSTLGVVSGYPDGGYHPEEGLTRAQFCKLAILIEGHGEQVKGSAYKTLFSDVPGSSWAAPYVNLAYQEGLVSGYGNGAFGPDDSVTTAQAVTVALHLLGYSNADIGPFWPEDYMEYAAVLGLLDGLDKGAEEPLTRGDAALLLYNLLRMEDTQGKDFYLRLCASTVETALVMETDATADDGTAHTVRVFASDKEKYFTKVCTLSDTFVGQRGTLLLDKSGSVSGFLPDGNTVRRFTAAEFDSETITAAGGGTFAIKEGTAVLTDSGRENYESCWYDLRAGDEIALYYTEGGAIDLVWVTEKAAAAARTVTGYYEDVSPNTTAPGTVTVLGASLSVSDAGRAALKAFSLGEKITVILDRDGKVADAQAAPSGVTYMVGVLDRYDSDKAEVTFPGGVTVSGKPVSTGGLAKLAGGLVRVGTSESGKISVLSLPAGKTAGDWDVAGGTLGGLTVSADVAVYERAGSSVAVELAPEDILVETVPAASIDYVGTNAAGEAALILLNDVTGEAYTYGILDVGEKSSGAGSMMVTNRTVAVENADGTGTAYITGIEAKDGTVGGVAATAEGKAAKITVLMALEGITRADFDGSDSVAGIPISEHVQVYNAATGKWTTLAAAKAFTNRFTVYYDRTGETGGQVRVIFAE